MMNKMLRKNRRVLEQMKDKKIILNKCVLSNEERGLRGWQAA